MAYSFSKPRREFDDGGTLCYALDAGDYSVELDGELLPIVIERKSLSDYFGVVGHGRERFERELARLRGMTAYLLIEADARTIKAGYERSLVSGNAALASAICWACKFGVNPIFASSRRLGQEICQRLLQEFALHYLELSP